MVDYGNLITDATPQDHRVFYGFTNVDCNAENSRLYPDFCRDTIAKNVTELLDKNLQLRLIWLTVTAYRLRVMPAHVRIEVKNNSDVCGNGELKFIDFLKVYAFNRSMDFQNALSDTCNLASTSANTDGSTQAPEAGGC